MIPTKYNLVAHICQSLTIYALNILKEVRFYFQFRTKKTYDKAIF